MDKFAKVEKKQDEPEANAYCLANGCNLRATLCDSTKGFYQGCCSYHYTVKDANHWPAVTDRIERNMSLIKWLQHLTKNAILYANRKKIECPVSSKFNKPEEDSYGDYIQRIETYLNRVILKGIEDAAFIKPEEKQGVKSAGEIIEEKA